MYAVSVLVVSCQISPGACLSPRVSVTAPGGNWIPVDDGRGSRARHRVRFERTATDGDGRFEIWAESTELYTVRASDAQGAMRAAAASGLDVLFG